MTGYSKRNEARRDDEQHVARKRATVDVDPLAKRPGSNGAQRNGANWAWARSGAHYDWMDHASPFVSRD